MRTVVLDTNVLLADPTVLLAYPDAEVLIPETVLGELDKLKTSRADPDLRYRGREVSRELFDLSEQGNLIDGVDLPEGGRIRVAPLKNETDLPEGLSPRNADDRILAVAIQECREGCEDLTLVTNDLNMLLKAQTMGVRVQRHGEGVEASFSRRYIIRPFQRYRIPLTILMISLAVFAAILVLVLTFQPRGGGGEEVNVPPDLRATFSPGQLRVLQLLQDLDKDPNDAQTQLQLANALYDIQNYQTAAKYFELYLRQQPNNLDAKTDLGSAYFSLGRSDSAIQLTTEVLEKNPNHTNANFNLGIMYWRARGDYQAAVRQFEKVIGLTENAPTDSEAHATNQLAKRNIAALKEEADSRGIEIESSITTGGTQ